MNLLVIGSVAMDTIRTPHGEVNDILGGSTVYASMAASNFCPVRIVGVVGNDFDGKHLELLAERGVDTGGIEVCEGETFRWHGSYDDLNSAQTLDTRLNVFADFNPVLPEKFKESEVVLLGNIQPGLQLSVLDQIKNPKLVACDTMNFWIDGAREELEKVIRRVDILFINEEELKMLTGIRNIYTAAKKALSYGLKYVVAKRGEYGALVAGENLLFSIPVYPVERVVDPTGAGDSFAGGFLGYLAGTGDFSEANIKQAMLYGTVCASLNIEDFSIRVMKKSGREQIEQRRTELIKLIAL